MDSETRTGAGDVAPPGHVAVPERGRRSEFVKRGLIVGGAALAGAAVAGAPRITDAAQLSRPDLRALELLLLVEYTEEAFYAEALRQGKLTGKVLQYARAVSAQEKQHRDLIRSTLGGRAESKPEFDFGDKTASPEAFARAAGDLEDLAVAAYNGQGTNVSTPILAAAGKIVSVEARHAAWIRSIVGQPPAPETTDTPQSANQVLDGLRQAGMRR
jgi:Ferritin-like domain